jgi:hypothetical protein
MSSAQCFTNRIRVQAEARLTKVQFPGNLARNSNPLEASVALSPDYTKINYVITNFCKNRKGCLLTK